MSSNQEIKDLICRSINDKKLLKISYKGDLERIIEPYAYGMDKHYFILLSAFQTAGFSSSGNIIGWKCFNIQDIKNILEMDEHFQVRPDYNPRGYSYTKTICKIC